MRPIRSFCLGNDDVPSFVAIDESAQIQNAVVWIVPKVILHKIEFVLQRGFDLLS